jgi:hypothetical protein
LLIEGRLTKTKIGEKLIFIRIDGGDVFIECRTSDFVQIKEKVVSFFFFFCGCPLLCTQDKLCSSKPFDFVHSVEVGRLSPIHPLLFHLKSQDNA